jgi:quercetin dioxygenase-like cupin family protein
MKKTSLSEVPKVMPELDARIMHSSSLMEIRHLCLNPGQSIPQHPNQYDVIACLISGEVVLNMGEKQTKLELFDVVEIEKDTDRGFTNNGSTDARLLIIKKL